MTVRTHEYYMRREGVQRERRARRMIRKTATGGALSPGNGGPMRECFQGGKKMNVATITLLSECSPFELESEFSHHSLHETTKILLIGATHDDGWSRLNIAFTIPLGLIFFNYLFLKSYL
jgi:hypothetical protein